MDRSIYTALNSMNILRDNQSVTAQNLANISVTGFQKDIQINFSSVYLDRDQGIDPRVMALQEPGGFDQTPGPMQQTGAPLDIAVDGSGYFIVKPAGGEVAMSRRGDFTVSADGTLRDGTGTQPLSVDREPIIVPPHRKISVSGVAAVGEAGADGYGTILSGSLERSNVDITEELVNLITAQRNFQANAKTIETNTSLTQAIIQIRS